MPQIGTHILIADRLAADPASDAEFRNNVGPRSLGAIGPDLTLFLFDPLSGSFPALTAAEKILDVVGEIEAKVKELEVLTGAPDAIANWLTGGLADAAIDLAKRAADSLIGFVAIEAAGTAGQVVANPFYLPNAAPNGPEYIPGLSNSPSIPIPPAINLSQIFRNFGHPYTVDLPVGREAAAPNDYDKWWWIDVLHYRRTGIFSKHLLDNARSPAQRAFAKGYLTHVAGDICGHPFVNTVVGGPFRNHALRHVVVEKVIDTWVWDHYQAEDITKAGLNKWITIDDNESNEIFDLMLSAMAAVYISGPAATHIKPGYFQNGVPKRDEMQGAYALLLRFLKRSTNSTLEPPKRPPDDIGGLMQELANEIEKTYGNITNGLTAPQSIWDIFIGIFAAIGWSFVLLIQILSLPVAALTRIVTLYPRALVWELSNLLYDIQRQFRLALALGGWGWASSLDLESPVLQSMCRIPPHRSGSNAFNYPHRLKIGEEGWWLRDPHNPNDPKDGLEKPLTEASPFVAHATPDSFIDATLYDMVNDQDLQSFATLDPAIDGPEKTQALQLATHPRPQFGGAVPFARKLLNGEYPLDTSFDLDADRGYGWQSWEAVNKIVDNGDLEFDKDGRTHLNSKYLADTDR